MKHIVKKINAKEFAVTAVALSAIFTVLMLFAPLPVSYNYYKRVALTDEQRTAIGLPAYNKEEAHAAGIKNQGHAHGFSDGGYVAHDNGEELYELYKGLRNELFMYSDNTFSISGIFKRATIEDTLEAWSEHGEPSWMSRKMIIDTDNKSYTYDEWINLHPDWYLSAVAKYEAEKDWTLNLYNGYDQVVYTKVLHENEHPAFPVRNGKHGVNVTQATAPATTVPANLVPTVTKDGKYMWNGVDFSVVFNPTVYADRYPDLKAAFGYNKELLFKHFIEHGVAEGRVAI